jgi:hypothetical protein
MRTDYKKQYFRLHVICDITINGDSNIGTQKKISRLFCQFEEANMRTDYKKQYLRLYVMLYYYQW